MNGFDSSTNNPSGEAYGRESSFTGSTGAAVPPEDTPGYGTGTPYGAGVPPYTAGTPYTAPGYVPPPAPGLPNPGLATLLGFIPGVGAMYNGQFAKGIAHIVIFAVLVSLSDHVNGIFGLLVAGWIFYMVFDAYQTARARREGLQVPDPFGLNNIGEKLGVGNGPNWSDFTARPSPGQAPPATGQVPPSQAWAAPESGPAQRATWQDTTGRYTPAPEPAAYQGTPANPYPADPPYPPYAAGAPSYGASPYPGSVPPAYPPYGTYAATYTPPITPATGLFGGLPTGALWLIGFGVFALLGTLTSRFSWSNRYLDGIIVTVVGVVLLATQTLRANSVYPAGTAASHWYLLRCARPGLVLLAVGVSLTLDHAHIITWNYLWPYLLILLGVYLLLVRAAYNRMLAAGPLSPAYTPPAAPYTPAGSATPNTSIAPSILPRDEEGR